MTAAAEPRSWAGRPIVLLVALPLLLHAPSLVGLASEEPAPIMSGMAQPESGGPGAGASVFGMASYPGWIDGNAGVTLEALGGLAARDWLHGRLPWWNPYSGAGLPLAAEGQNAAMFLPFVLLLALPCGLVWLKIAMQILAGIAMLALLRRLRLGGRPALTGAILCECSGSFAWLAHGPILPIPFLPLLLLGIEQAFQFSVVSSQLSESRGPGRLAGWSRGVPTIALAVGFSLTAGFPEVAFLDGLLAAGWSLVRLAQSGRSFGWLLMRLALGVALGLLLSAPATVPFLTALPAEFVGLHAGRFGHVLPGANLALMLYPYLFGPVMYGVLAHGIQGPIWFSAGGFMGLLLLLLALTGVASRGGARALRWWLGLWIGLAAVVSCVPAAGRVVGFIPGIAQVNLPVWVVPSVLVASFILAGFALDAWERGILGWPRVASVLAAAAGIAVLPAAWPEVRALLAFGGAYPFFVLASLLWGGSAAAAAAWLLRQSPNPLRRRWLHALVAADAVLLFAVPLAARTPPLFWDWPTLDFLHQTAGLGRVWSAGPMPPNYGAWFGIAELNHNYLPVPANWVGEVRGTIMPGMDGVNFHDGAFDTPSRDRLRARSVALADFGVSLVLTWPGVDPYTQTIAPAVAPGPQLPLPLARDGSFEGSISSGAIQTGEATAIGIRIGTYLGQSDGALEAKLCTPQGCSSGRSPLASAVDNARLRIALTPPLPVVAGETLTYRVTHRDGDHAVALWASLSAGGDPGARVPDVTVAVQLPGAAATLVHHGTAADVWALRDPRPYWRAPGCTLSNLARTTLDAVCDRPSTLRRLELWFPGWTATLNGRAAPMRRDPPVFQAIDLPAGRSSITFSYAPPGIGWAWLGFAAGIVGLAGASGRALPDAMLRARGLAATGWHRCAEAAMALRASITRDPAPAAFAIWLLPLLLTVAWLTPPWQNSDEPTHVLRTVQVAHGQLAGFRLFGSAGGLSDNAAYAALTPIVGVGMHPETRVTRSGIAASEAVRWHGTLEASIFPNTAQYPPAFYVPAAAAYWVGRAAGMPVDRTVLLMRFANALAFTGVAWLALAAARRLRPLLAAILMLPMTLSLACAASQDSLMIAVFAVAVAMLDRIVSEAREGSGREIVVVATLLTLVGMARPPYAFLLPLVLLARRRRDKGALLALGAGLSVVFGWCLLVALRTMVKLGGADAARQLHLILADPLVVPRVAIATLAEFLARYWHEFIGTLGWTDAPVPMPFVGFASGVLALAAAASTTGTSRGRSVTLAALLTSVVSIFAVQYLTWTWPGQTVVTGVLGRYFIVPAMAAGLALPSIRHGAMVRRRGGFVALGLMALITPAVIIHTLVLRYYLQ